MAGVTVDEFTREVPNGWGDVAITTDDLIVKIQVEIDKDERLANGEDERAHNERHWPDRIERQAAAFRKILDWAQRRNCANGEHLLSPPDPYDLVEALAEVYAIEVPKHG